MDGQSISQPAPNLQNGLAGVIMMIITLFINLQIDSLKVRCQDSDTDSHQHQYVAARLLLSVTLVSRKPNEGKSP